MWERSAKVGWGRARGTHAGIQGARKVPIREDERRDDPLSRVVRIAEDRISQEFQVISKPVGVRREREDLWERLSSWSRIDASGVCVRRNGRFCDLRRVIPLRHLEFWLKKIFYIYGYDRDYFCEWEEYFSGILWRLNFGMIYTLDFKDQRQVVFGEWIWFSFWNINIIVMIEWIEKVIIQRRRWEKPRLIVNRNWKFLFILNFIVARNSQNGWSLR